MNYKGLLEGLVHLIYPSLCIACQENDPFSDQRLCLPCLQELPFVYNSADSMAALEGKDFFPPGIRYFRSLFYYTKESLVAEMIHRLKYNGQYRIGHYLGHLLSEKMQSEQSWSDYQIVPVPLHAKKRKSRGFNQAEEIAKGLQKGFTIPVRNNLLIRSRNESSQTAKDKWERSRILKESITINHTGQIPKRVLLVDDVITTGSTIAACANLLFEAGTKNLSVASLAVSV